MIAGVISLSPCMDLPCRREAIDVGGRDHQLRDLIDASLHDAGFNSKIVTSGSHAATSRSNICNKGRRGAG